MKVNRRLINIALVSLVIAGIITFFIFDTIQKAAQPEPTEPIAYFKYNLDKDTVLKQSDIVFLHTPVSLIPKTAVRSYDEIRGKRLMIRAEAGDMVLTGKLIERGDVKVDVKDYWTIGLDVTNISNYLGGNLKDGGDYILLHKNLEQPAVIISKVKIANLVDSAGKIITDNGDGLIKTVNVSVEDEGTLLDIATKKESGSFELVDAPQGYELPEKAKPSEEKSMTEVQE